MLNKIKKTSLFILTLIWSIYLIIWIAWAFSTSSSADVEYPEDYMNDYGNSKIGN